MMNLTRSMTLAVMIAVVSIGCNANKSAARMNNTGSISSEQRQALKDYALCKCISLIAPDDTAFKNDISASLYFDAGMPINLYRNIDRMADSVFRNIKPSQIADHNGHKAYMSSCIEFSRSVQLDSLIKVYRTKHNN